MSNDNMNKETKLKTDTILGIVGAVSSLVAAYCGFRMYNNQTKRIGIEVKLIPNQDLEYIKLEVNVINDSTTPRRIQLTKSNITYYYPNGNDRHKQIIGFSNSDNGILRIEAKETRSTTVEILANRNEKNVEILRITIVEIGKKMRITECSQSVIKNLNREINNT